MKITPKILYNELLKNFGNLNWWPIDENYHKKNNSDPRFEVIVGAILTQNTTWSNVEKALANLKQSNLLDIKNISELNIDELQDFIRPSGFFKQKAKRLKDFVSYLIEKYNGDLSSFFDRDITFIRDELLSLKGIGPETADSIILYAGNLPIFVVDAYTKRICQRLPLNTNIKYDEIQEYFEKEISKHFKKNELVRVYNELHAMIVLFAKNYCKKNPDCARCPFKEICKYNT